MSHPYNEEQFQLILAHGPHSTVREVVRMGLNRAANREGVDLYLHTPDGECVRALALVDRGDKQFAALVGDGDLDSHHDRTTIRVEINAASFRGAPAKALAWSEAACFAARIGLQFQTLLESAQTERQAWLEGLKQTAQ
jgi:hypothetical protein